MPFIFMIILRRDDVVDCMVCLNGLIVLAFLLYVLSSNRVRKVFKKKSKVSKIEWYLFRILLYNNNKKFAWVTNFAHQVVTPNVILVFLDLTHIYMSNTARFLKATLSDADKSELWKECLHISFSFGLAWLHFLGKTKKILLTHSFQWRV